ncbi:MAG: F0F1 ATP synthase subunit B' [Rhodospirillales bacterium]|nr:MAG: F0F1 ATP synthase subunit B' [Rhodospirillales bacterium]
MVALVRSVAVAALAAVTFVGSGSAFAAAEGNGGLPQFDSSTFLPQLFWLAAILVVFFLIVRNNALPRIGEALEARRQKIDDDLDKAAAHREEAEAVMAEYEKSLAEAADKAHVVQREAAEAIASLAAARRAEVAARLAEDTKAAEARIAAAKEPAIASLQDVAADVVQQAAAKLAGMKITASEAKAAVKSSLKETG